MAWTPDAHRQALIALWVAMGQLYGDRWTQRWGDHISDLWRVALEDVSPDSIRAGMRALVKSSERYVPTPGRFRELCIESQPRVPAAPRRSPFADDTDPEYTRAKGAVMAGYHRRLTAGMRQAEVPAPQYDGEFPVVAVVSAAPHVDLLAVRSAANNPHPPQAITDGYRELLRIFNAEWREFVA